MRIMRQFCNTCLQVLPLQLEKQLEIKHKNVCLKRKQIGLLTLLSWQCQQAEYVSKKAGMKKRGFFWFTPKDGVVKTVIHGYIYIGKLYEYLFLFYFNWIFPKDEKAFVYCENLIIQSLQSILLQFFYAFGHKIQALRSSFSNRKVKTFELSILVEGCLTLNKCHADPPHWWRYTHIAIHHTALTAVCIVME